MVQPQWKLRDYELQQLKFLKQDNISPSYMKNIFTPETNPEILPHDIIVKHHNTATYGGKSLSALGPKIWNKRLQND